MNPLLTSIEGMDEFVVAIAPNRYSVALRITPEEAVHFAGHERISLGLEITGAGTAGVFFVRAVGDDNQPGTWTTGLGDEDFTPEQYSVLTAPAFELRVNEAVTNFYEAVKDDLDEYFALTGFMRGGIGSLDMGSTGPASLVGLLEAILGKDGKE